MSSSGAVYTQNVRTLPSSPTTTWLCSQVIAGNSVFTMRLERLATGGISSMVTRNVRSTRYRGIARPYSSDGSVRNLVARSDSSGGGLLQLGDHDPLHAHHRVGHALRSLTVAGRGQLDQPARHDLPGHSEAVLQPAARPLLAAVGERVPEV